MYAIDKKAPYKYFTLIELVIVKQIGDRYVMVKGLECVSVVANKRVSKNKKI